MSSLVCCKKYTIYFAYKWFCIKYKMSNDFAKTIFDCYLDENSITPDLLDINYISYTPNSP